MTLTQYLRVLRTQWLVVLLLVVLGAGAAAAYTYRQTPVYSAQTQLFVSVRSTDAGIATLNQGSAFTQQRVKSYADIVTSPIIAEAVITELRLPFTAEQLVSRISATSPMDTVLLDITVTDTDPVRAAAIADAVGAEFPRLVNRLETPSGRTVSPVLVSVTRRAGVPTSPVAPRIPLNLALGLLLGLALGVGAAVLRDQLNTSVNGVADVERLTGAIPLGVVPYDATAAKHPLVTTDQFGGRAEAFRTLRTNLQFADVDDPPRVIAVSSALPDEGKTTTACNVALTLAQSGARVVLVEGDLRKPAVGRYLGISNAAGLTNVLAGQHHLADVIVGYQRDTLAVLPSGPTPPNPSEMLGSQQMRYLLKALAAEYDVVVIDAPPLLPVTDAAVLAAAADGVMLVVRHGRSRREEVQRALQALESVNAKVLGTVLNFAPQRRRRGGYDGYGYGYGYGTAPVTRPAPERTSRRRRRKAAAAVAAAGSAQVPPALESTVLPELPPSPPAFPAREPATPAFPAPDLSTPAFPVPDPATPAFPAASFPPAHVSPPNFPPPAAPPPAPPPAPLPAATPARVAAAPQVYSAAAPPPVAHPPQVYSAAAPPPVALPPARSALRDATPAVADPPARLPDAPSFVDLSEREAPPPGLDAREPGAHARRPRAGRPF